MSSTKFKKVATRLTWLLSKTMLACTVANASVGAPLMHKGNTGIAPIINILLIDEHKPAENRWLGTFHSQDEIVFWSERIKGDYFRVYDDHPLINGNHNSIANITNNASVFLGEAGGGWETFLWYYPYPYRADGVAHYNSYFDSTTIVDPDRHALIDNLESFQVRYDRNLAISVPNSVRVPFESDTCNGTIEIKNGDAWKVSMPANSPHQHDWKTVRDAAFVTMLAQADNEFAKQFFNRSHSAKRTAFEGIGPAGSFVGLNVRSLSDSRDLVKQFLLTQFDSKFKLDLVTQQNIWCPVSERSRAHISPFFTYANGFTELLFAYEYLRTDFDPTERKRMKDVLVSGAQIWGDKIEQYIGYHMPYLFLDGHPRQFENRQDASSNQPSSIKRYKDDTDETYEISKFFNNRALASARYALLAAIHLTEVHRLEPDFYQLNENEYNALLAVRSKMRAFAKAAIAFQIDPDDGVITELVRGNQNARAGMIYISTTLGTLVSMAEALARTGDTSVYEFRENAGAGATLGSGGLEDALEWMVKVMSGKVEYFNLNDERFTDVKAIEADVIAAARYYGSRGNRRLRESLYRLQTSDVPKLEVLDPSEAGGEWGVFVDAYFMFLDVNDSQKVYP